ncbi:putative NRPS-like protein biosynthetic cluster [Pleurotus pulmonarius]|nr:putative NRPS-like protein biosynthetic cluster [Pleurotus pulmonarius]
MPGKLSSSYGKALSDIPGFPVLVPSAIDYRASEAPNRVILTYPQPGTKKFVDITWAQFAHAVDKAAWKFDSQIGARRVSSDPVKVVGVLARSDVAYMVTIYALHKCGVTPLMISTRNSHAATVNLLKLTGSVALLADSYHKPAAEAAVAEVGGIPIFEHASLPGPVTEDRRPFPFNLKYVDECDNPGVILHTSGSTGLPKPVAWSTRFFWHQTFYPDEYVQKYVDSSFLSTLPMFHGSGFSLIRASLLWLGWKVIFPDPSKPVTASAIADICNQISPDIVAGAPSVIGEITSLPGGMDVMKARKTWFFVGAPVPPHFGDRLVKEGVHITPNLGSTEIGQMSVLEPEGRTQEDWNYHEIRPDLDIRLQSHGSTLDEGPFELIIFAKDGWKPGVVNVTIDGVEGYATSDLYQRHPTHPRLLKHCGRVDDVIVLSNGEKTLSRAIEVPIEADPLVQNAIVFGSGRAHNGVLIVPTTEASFDPRDAEKLVQFRDDIWPSVEVANSVNPTHSRIWKEMLLVVSPDTALPRTDKGSLKRKLVLELYKDQIDELYAAVEDAASAKSPPLPGILTAHTFTTYFTRLVNEAMNKAVQPTEDVFELGMDSLKAIFVRNSLLSSLKKDDRTKNVVGNVPQNFVFSNTTIEQMANALALLLETGHLEETGQESAEEHARMVNEMVAKYTRDFPTHEGLDGQDTDTEVVVLTGSTGSLGTYLLNSLLAQSSVIRVYALNRKGSPWSEQRQEKAFAERQLNSEGLRNEVRTGRLEFHDVELNQPGFGLPDGIYNTILASTTLVIHNAWSLNFNWTLSTFEPVHIRGVRNLVDFALSSPRKHPPRIAFTSSISTVGAYTTGMVPETPLSDPMVCMPHGYARAKFVSERILAVAAEERGLTTASFRIGQIAGDSVHGIWNSSDSVPALLKGCQELGIIPTDWVPSLTWTPVDTVAQTIVDICMNRDEAHGTFHVSHPSPTPWIAVVPHIASRLATKTHPEIKSVTMREWVLQLKESGHSPETNPAIKLVAFFENAMNGRGVRCQLDLSKSKDLSSALKEARVFDQSTIDLFLNHWKSTNFLL